jgi:hypothetical protein
VDGVGSGRASKLGREGYSTPGDLTIGGVEDLVNAGLSEGVAERVFEAAKELPAPRIEWGAFPDSIARGENDHREVRVVNDGGGANAHLRVTVNGVEMTATETYLGEDATLPVAVFGANDDELTYEVSVAFPDHPLVPVADTRTVEVE